MSKLKNIALVALALGASTALNPREPNTLETKVVRVPFVETLSKEALVDYQACLKKTDVPEKFATEACAFELVMTPYFDSKDFGLVERKYCGADKPLGNIVNGSKVVEIYCLNR